MKQSSQKFTNLRMMPIAVSEYLINVEQVRFFPFKSTINYNVPMPRVNANFRQNDAKLT